MESPNDQGSKLGKRKKQQRKPCCLRVKTVLKNQVFILNKSQSLANVSMLTLEPKTVQRQTRETHLSLHSKSLNFLSLLYVKVYRASSRKQDVTGRHRKSTRIPNCHLHSLQTIKVRHLYFLLSSVCAVLVLCSRDAVCMCVYYYYYVLCLNVKSLYLCWICALAFQPVCMVLPEVYGSICVPLGSFLWPFFC